MTSVRRRWPRHSQPGAHGPGVHVWCGQSGSTQVLPSHRNADAFGTATLTGNRPRGSLWSADPQRHPHPIPSTLGYVTLGCKKDFADLEMEDYPEFSRWALPAFTSILKRKAEGGLATEEEIGPERGSESSECCEATLGAKGAGTSRGWKRLPGPPPPCALGPTAP